MNGLIEFGSGIDLVAVAVSLTALPEDQVRHSCGLRLMTGVLSGAA